jgi:hypothetical protein
MGFKLKLAEGQRFGLLTILKEDQRNILPCGQKNRVFLCKCDCGKEKKIRLLHLVRGRINSCGCLAYEYHGDAGTHLHNVWRGMKTRRYNEQCKEKSNVCVEWKNSYLSFKKWCLSNGYSRNLQIDRIDNSKGYYPENCRWVTSIVNMANRDCTYFIDFQGQNKPFMDIIREYGLESKQHTIRDRIKRGWKTEEAILTPIKKGNYRTKEIAKDKGIKI